MNSPTVVVHGATGVQGSPVVRRLLSAGLNVRAAVRDITSARLPAGAKPVFADLADVDSLAAAYEGADAVVVQLPLVFSDLATVQANAVLAALGRSKVDQVVFSSGGVLATEPAGIPFVDARALLNSQLREVAARASIVAPALTYMENLAAPWSVPLLASGTLAYPLPAALPVSWVAADDVAAVVAGLLGEVNPPTLQVVSGPEALTGGDAAKQLSASLGRDIGWRTVTPAEYEHMLAPHLGRETAAGVAAAYLPPPPGAPVPAALDPAAVHVGQTSLGAWAANLDLRGALK